MVATHFFNGLYAAEWPIQSWVLGAVVVGDTLRVFVRIGGDWGLLRGPGQIILSNDRDDQKAGKREQSGQLQMHDGGRRKVLVPSSPLGPF